MAHRKLAEREKRFLQLLDATETINSGATFEDGDGYVELLAPIDYSGHKKIFVEVKSTDKESFSLKLMDWKKYRKQGTRIGMLPLMGIDIQGERLVVLTLSDFMSIIAYSQDMIGDTKNK